jgi:DNA-binding PadR family transcriptional regulator
MILRSGILQYRILILLIDHPYLDYGATMAEHLQDHRGNTPPRSSVYAALRALQAKRFVTAKRGHSLNMRDGRACTHYRITELGRDAVREFKERYDKETQ